MAPPRNCTSTARRWHPAPCGQTVQRQGPVAQHHRPFAWPDNLFKGAVSNFRVYDAALTADQVAAISTADASIHAGELTGSVLNGIIIPTTVDDPFISLPTANGVTWASSDSSVIATDGTVNQPAKARQPRLSR